jgi:SAM-dependent methyltransferase
VAQIVSGVRRVLSIPAVYDLFQRLVGDHSARQVICAEYLRVKEGDVVVDIGCGTGQIRSYLPDDIRYFGFDLSPQYIETARTEFPERSQFICANIISLAPDAIPRCDLALAFGVLHHLDDVDARELLAHVHLRLSERGRLVTIDPVIEEQQSRVARALIERDRGRNVRMGDAYRALVPAVFSRVDLHVRRDLLRIPYSHAILECSR